MVRLTESLNFHMQMRRSAAAAGLGDPASKSMGEPTGWHCPSLGSIWYDATVNPA